MRWVACGSEAVTKRPERTAYGYRRFGLFGGADHMQPSDEPRKQGRHELTVPPSMIRTNRPSHTEPRRRRRIAASSRIGDDPERAWRRGFPPAGVVGRRCARGPDVVPVTGRSVRGQARGRPVLSADGFSSLSTASTAWAAYPGRLVAGHAPEQRPLARPTTGAAGPAAAPAPHGPDPATTAMSRTASHGPCARSAAARS